MFCRRDQLLTIKVKVTEPLRPPVQVAYAATLCIVSMLYLIMIPTTQRPVMDLEAGWKPVMLANQFIDTAYAGIIEGKYHFVVSSNNPSKGS